MCAAFCAIFILTNRSSLLLCHATMLFEPSVIQIPKSPAPSPQNTEISPFTSWSPSSISRLIQSERVKWDNSNPGVWGKSPPEVLKKQRKANMQRGSIWLKLMSPTGFNWLSLRENNCGIEIMPDFLKKVPVAQSWDLLEWIFSQLTATVQWCSSQGRIQLIRIERKVWDGKWKD